MTSFSSPSHDQHNSMPSPSLMQNFIAFKSHGGVTEEFALNAGVDNEKQIFYATA